MEGRNYQGLARLNSDLRQPEAARPLTRLLILGCAARVSSPADAWRASTTGDSSTSAGRRRGRGCRAGSARRARSAERWAADSTPVYRGRDGWPHVAAVIDCHDRELVGHEFALRGRAK